MIHNKEILLAFSGGIDSCAAAESLRREGWSVTLLTIDMLGDEALLTQATTSASMLGLELITIDAKERFEREIINDFISEYRRGHTPAPCTLCNTLIKWKIVIEQADRLGIYHIATGHYFKIAEHSGHLYISRAKDPRKDQSYYLWGVEESILRRTITPMGERIKEEVIRTSHISRESMGICFLRGAHYSDFIEARCGLLSRGEVIDRDGRVVGQHNGLARYTIGQRRGEGIPQGARVIEIIADRDQIRIGDNSELYRRSFEIERCHFIDAQEVAQSSEISVMIRGIGRNPKGYADIEIEGESAIITLRDDPAWAVAQGQPVALYIGDRVVGGGYIK